MTEVNKNIDPAEQKKFDNIAASWWDPDGVFHVAADATPATALAGLESDTRR